MSELSITFEKFPSLARFTGPVYVTEKIDGTNAQICIEDDGTFLVGSRTRWITPTKDNFGFARWAYDRQADLTKLLGPGRHYGEWWGSGIQRGYGLKDRRFSLFNVARWRDVLIGNDLGIATVPLLYVGSFDTSAFVQCMLQLQQQGSIAAPGFMNPEGIVVYDTRSGVGFKKTFDYDDTGKGGIRDEDGNVVLR